MRLAELQKLLLSALAEAMAAREFRYVKREQYCVQKTAAAARMFHIAFIRHTDDLDATADVAVTYDLGAKQESVTIGAELGNWTGIGQHRWRVSGPESVAPAAKDIIHWFERIARPFFERFGLPAEALRVLEEDGREADLISPFRSYRTASRDRLRAALKL